MLSGPMNWTMVTDYLNGLHAANLSAIYMLDMFSCREVRPASDPPPPHRTTRAIPRGGAIRRNNWSGRRRHHHHTRCSRPSPSRPPDGPPLARMSSPPLSQHTGMQITTAPTSGRRGGTARQTSTEVVGEFVAHVKDHPVRPLWPVFQAPSRTRCPLPHQPHLKRYALLEGRLDRVLIDAFCPTLCPNNNVTTPSSGALRVRRERGRRRRWPPQRYPPHRHDQAAGPGPHHTPEPGAGRQHVVPIRQRLQVRGAPLHNTIASFVHGAHWHFHSR